MATPTTPIGDAIGSVIDGNEPVAVGTAVASAYSALQAFAIYKEWVTAGDVLALQPVIIALIVLGGVAIRSKVWSKESAKELLATEPPAGPVTDHTLKAAS